jgi:hypothetical protein
MSLRLISCDLAWLDISGWLGRAYYISLCLTLKQSLHSLFQSSGFFRGLAFPLWSYGFLNSIYFGVYGNTLRWLNEEQDDKKEKRYYLNIYVAGAVAGAAQVIPACPIEVIKVTLQSQIESGMALAYATRHQFVSCISLLKGHLATMLYNMLYSLWLLRQSCVDILKKMMIYCWTKL